MNHCPLCGGKMIGRLFLAMDKAQEINEDRVQKRVEDTCQKCGAYVTKYNFGVPMLFKPLPTGLDQFLGIVQR